MPTSPRLAPGPFHPDQLRPKDPYELSDGHAIRCAPTGSDGGRAITAGVRALASDPAVEEIGVDVGYSPSRRTLRAPDIAIGNVPNKPGWVTGVPMLAVEYAGSGQDEDDLATKIGELLDAGTSAIWVVRLVGPRRVEIHRKGAPMSVVGPGEVLTAPGILANPLPVEALWEPSHADRVALRNVLGAEDLDKALASAHAEGREEGREEGRTEGREEGRGAGLDAAATDVVALVNAFVASRQRAPTPEELDVLRRSYLDEGLDAAMVRARG